MANWLQKILPPAPPREQSRGNMPVRMRQGQLYRPSGPPQSGRLPNASVIYGIAASVLFVVALYFLLFEHRPITGLLVMLPAGCFLGFALHFLKYTR